MLRGCPTLGRSHSIHRSFSSHMLKKFFIFWFFIAPPEERKRCFFYADISRGNIFSQTPPRDRKIFMTRGPKPLLGGRRIIASRTLGYLWHMGVSIPWLRASQTVLPPAPCGFLGFIGWILSPQSKQTLQNSPPFFAHFSQAPPYLPRKTPRILGQQAGQQTASNRLLPRGYPLHSSRNYAILPGRETQ